MVFKLHPSPGLQLNMQGLVLEVEEAEVVTLTVLVAVVHEMTEGMCPCFGIKCLFLGGGYS